MTREEIKAHDRASVRWHRFLQTPEGQRIRQSLQMRDERLDRLKRLWQIAEGTLVLALVLTAAVILMAFFSTQGAL